jgi:hypothetical protein
MKWTKIDLFSNIPYNKYQIFIKSLSIAGLLFFTALCSGCSQSSFMYRNEYKILESKSNVQNDIDWISTESGGTVFDSCKAVNEKAMLKIRKMAKIYDNKQITKIQWFNESTEQWTSEPQCHSSYVGLLGIVFFLSWENATTVKVRVLLEKSHAATYAGKKRYGTESPSNSEIRENRSNIIKYGLGLFGGFFEVGTQYLPNVQLHMESNAWASATYSKSGYMLTRWSGVFITSRYFVNDYLHIKFGLGAHRTKHQYIDIYDGDNKTKWTDDTLAALFSFGHEQVLRKGLIVGIDWLSINFPLKLIERRGDIHPSQSHQVRTFQPTMRALTLKLGLAF